MAEHLETLCEYHVLDGGIHEFIIKDFSRAGADGLIELLQQIQSSLRPDDVSSLLIDSSRGTLPINYTFTRVRQRGEKWRDDSRVAVIVQSSVMISILSNLLRMLPRLSFRLFTPDKREAALDWLRNT